MSWWDETDKIELPAVDGEHRLPAAMSMSYAWPESIDVHWDRIWAITQEARANQWKYRSYLPYRKKFLSIYRRAFDGLPCPRWARELSKEQLYVGLCVDDNRRPIPYEDAIKPLEARAAKGLAYRDAKAYLQRSIREERLSYHEETVEAIKWFRAGMMNKIVYWEEALPEGTVWRNHCRPARALYVSKIAQKVQNVDRNKVTIVLVDSKLSQFTLTCVDFKAWIEDGMLYITEFPYIGVGGRKMKRIRLRLAEGK
jgi:hypothetical protein